jgi:hypothetical protein
MNRDLYAVLVTSANGITPRATQNDTHSAVADVLRVLILANNNPVTPEDIAAGAEPIPEDVSLYELVSWDGQRIPLDARAGQIPKPGVFFVLEASIIEPNGGVTALLMLVKRELNREGGPAKFQRHLAGPWAHWMARPLSTFDVLVSASDADDALAGRIEAGLVGSGLSTQRSARRSVADLGDVSLRQRLLECQVVISLITPRSVHDPRVSIEAGACWVMTKPFVPLLSGLSKAELPASMAARQCVEVDDDDAMKRLPAQIAALVLGR